MTSNLSLTELRLDFARERHITSPIAICWAVAGAFGAVFTARFAPMAMFICVGMIFPLGLLVGRSTFVQRRLFFSSPDPRNHLWRSLDDS